MKKRVLVGIAWSVGLCLPLIVKDTFSIHVANLIFLGSALSLSWAILALTGYIGFCHNALIGIGAYTSAYLVMKMGAPFLGGFFAAGIMAALFALVLGLIVLRLKDIFFILSTFAFAQIMLRVFKMAEKITGGPDGIRDIPAPAFYGFGQLQSHGDFYIFFYIYISLVILFSWRLFNSVTGRQFKAIGEDMFIAEALGINTFRQKVNAFVISAFIAGLGGSLHAHYFFFISDTTFETTKAIEVVMYNVVGGMGSIIGPILGAIIMIPLPEFLRSFVAYQIALYGLILILILRFFPAGIWGGVCKLRSARKNQDEGKLKSLAITTPNLEPAFLASFKSPSNDPSVLMECDGVGKTFGGLEALKDVSFSVRKGDILGVVGPNGAGKSTILNLITGVLQPTKGQITFEGQNIVGARSSYVNHLGISRVFQASKLFNDSTVRENIARALIAGGKFNAFKDFFGMQGRSNAWVSRNTQLILEMFDFLPISEQKPKNLPHGFQRLVGLAMALASRPKLLLLDEPVSGMSFEEIEIVRETLQKINRSGLTIIVVEHNVNFVTSLCQNIVVLDHGHKIAQDTPERVMSNPTVIEAFLGGQSGVS